MSRMWITNNGEWGHCRQYWCYRYWQSTSLCSGPMQLSGIYNPNRKLSILGINIHTCFHHGKWKLSHLTPVYLCSHCCEIGSGVDPNNVQLQSLGDVNLSHKLQSFCRCATAQLPVNRYEHFDGSIAKKLQNCQADHSRKTMEASWSFHS